MSIDVRFLLATEDELRLRCRGWKRARRLDPPELVDVFNPFTKSVQRVERDWTSDDEDDDATPAPALSECFMNGTTVGNPMITEAAIVRLGRALGVPGGPAVVPAWVGPGAVVEEMAPALSRLLRDDEAAARAREVAAGAEVEPALVEALIADAVLAGELGREIWLYAEVDGVSESWSELADRFEAAHPHDGTNELDLLRALAADAHEVLYTDSFDALATRLLAPRLRPFLDRILVLLALSATEHAEHAEVVARVVSAVHATPGAFDEATRAAVVWTFPAMVQVCGKRFGVDAAFRVLDSRPEERALVRALYFHEIEDPHRDVDVAKLVARVSRLSSDDHRPALEAIFARKGVAAAAAAERLLLTASEARTEWVDVVVDAAPPESLLRSLATQPRAAVRARIAAALAETGDAGRAHALVVALLHAWFGEGGFDTPAVPGELAVLVNTDGVPTLRGSGVGNLTGDIVAPWKRTAVQRDPDATIDDMRWARAHPARDVATLTADERAMLVDLHACELVWSQDVPALRAYGFPDHRGELGAYLGVSTPARKVVPPTLALGEPILLRAHDDLDATELHVLHVVRDYLDEAFAAPMVVARALPLDLPRPSLRGDGGIPSYAHGWRGAATITICAAGPLKSGGYGRFGSYRSKTGELSLHAMREGGPPSQLLGRAVRILAQLSLLILGYPFCPSGACLLAPGSILRPRAPGEHMIMNTSFGAPADVMSVPLVPCSDCLAVAASHARRTPSEHLEALAAFFTRHGLFEDAAAARAALAS